MNRLFNCLFLIMLLSSCGGKLTEKPVPLTPFEKKINEVSQSARVGKPTSPIALKFRKLKIDEIAEHLDMDEETAQLHLKSTNIHGYYSLTARNLPESGEFILYHRNMEGKITPGKIFFVNGNNELVTKLDDLFIRLSNSYMFFSNYLPGEPVDFILVSKDRKLFAAIHLVPNPIEKTFKQAKIGIEIASPDKRRYLIHGSGFQPRSEYMVISHFENEQAVHTLEANDRGEFFQFAGPQTSWVTGGDGSIEVRGDGLPRLLTFNFKWGRS